MEHHDGEAVIVEAVTRFFRAVEHGNWDAIAASLTDPVVIAHGRDRQTLSPRQLASQWQQSHAGFATTRYQLEPVHISTAGDRATTQLVSRVTLTPPESAEDAALIIDGSYTVELERVHHQWKIRSLRHDRRPLGTGVANGGRS